MYLYTKNLSISDLSLPENDNSHTQLQTIIKKITNKLAELSKINIETTNDEIFSGYCRGLLSILRVSDYCLGRIKQYGKQNDYSAITDSFFNLKNIIKAKIKTAQPRIEIIKKKNSGFIPYYNYNEPSTTPEILPDSDLEDLL